MTLLASDIIKKGSEFVFQLLGWNEETLVRALEIPRPKWIMLGQNLPSEVAFLHPHEATKRWFKLYADNLSYTEKEATKGEEALQEIDFNGVPAPRAPHPMEIANLRAGMRESLVRIDPQDDVAYDIAKTFIDKDFLPSTRVLLELAVDIQVLYTEQLIAPGFLSMLLEEDRDYIKEANDMLMSDDIVVAAKGRKQSRRFGESATTSSKGHEDMKGSISPFLKEEMEGKLHTLDWNHKEIQAALNPEIPNWT